MTSPAGLSIPFTPEVNGFSIKDIDTLIKAVETRIEANKKEVLLNTEVAELLGVTVRTVDRMRKAGSLKGHRMAGVKVWFYLRSEIIEKIRKS